MSRMLSNLQDHFDFYLDAKSLPILLKVLTENRERISLLKRTGARLRCLTEIKQESLTACKDLMKDLELYHVSSLMGCFAIADDREYLGYLAYSDGDEKVLSTISTTFVDTQKFLVNVMLEKATPATQRIREISKGTEEEFMETIRDSLKLKSLVSILIQSAAYEIAILFSTRNSFLIAEREGILQEVSNISSDGIKVKILVMQDETVKEISDSKLKSPDLNVQVNYLQQLLPTKITTFIIDRAKSLTIEINDDSKETFSEAVGLGTYSNSESTVFSNVSIFESLWIQAIVDKQTQARQTYFKLFKGLRLKDEIYNRRWASNKDNDDKRS